MQLWWIMQSLMNNATDLMQHKTKFSGSNQHFNDAWIDYKNSKEKGSKTRKLCVKYDAYCQNFAVQVLNALDCSWPCLHVQDYMIFCHNWIKKLGFEFFFINAYCPHSQCMHTHEYATMIKIS